MSNSGSKGVALVALFVGVIGLTLGFAAFSQSLTINSSAKVSPEASTFTMTIVPISGTGTTITPTTTGGATGDVATISGTTISGLKANFTQPGQTVTYTANAKNTSAYVAYLKNVTMTAKGTCTAGTGATSSLVTSACNGISLSVKVGDETFTSTKVPTGTHSVAKTNGTETIVVTITYAAGSAQSDGPFTIAFSPVTLDYSTAQ